MEYLRDMFKCTTVRLWTGDMSLDNLPLGFNPVRLSLSGSQLVQTLLSQVMEEKEGDKASRPTSFLRCWLSHTAGEGLEAIYQMDRTVE